MAATLGDNIILLVNGSEEDQYVFAATRAHIITTECETIEVCSPSQGKWREYIAGRKKWSLNVGWLVLANDDVRKVLLAGSAVTIKIKGRGSADISGLTGSAILKTCKISAVRGNLATGSFAFVGNGPLT